MGEGRLALSFRGGIEGQDGSILSPPTASTLPSPFAKGEGLGVRVSRGAGGEGKPRGAGLKNLRTYAASPTAADRIASSLASP